MLYNWDLNNFVHQLYLNLKRWMRVCDFLKELIVYLADRQKEINYKVLYRVL